AAESPPGRSAHPDPGHPKSLLPKIRKDSRMPINNLNAEDLGQFIGSEQWYRHSLVRSITYTDGAKHVADHGGAYWLLDEIALDQKFRAAVKAEHFVF